MSTIYVMEACNLFCGDHDPAASKHLTLAELKLPPLQEIYQDHHAGGSRVQIEVAVGDTGSEAGLCIALVFRVLQTPTDDDLALLRSFARQRSLEIWLQPKGPDSIELLCDREGDAGGVSALALDAVVIGRDAA